jgi:hypothetical protein
MEQKLWVVMFSTQIADQIRKLLESGKFTEATTTNDLLKAFQEKISSEVQKSGGHLHVFLPEWMVIQITPSLAEQIPELVKSFNDQVGYSLATGIGLNFGEAVKAAKISEETGDIQLFEEDMSKSLELPPNLFDYGDQSIANNDENTDAQEQTYTKGPDYKASLQLAAEQLQAIIQQLGGQAQQDAAQQVQQIQQQQAAQQQQQAQAQPRDLVDALHGEQVGDRNPYRAKSDDKDSDKKSSDKSDDDSDTEKDEEPTDDSDGDEVQQKLGGALLHIKEQIPQLMDLAEKNPDAFKQSMTLIQKLLSLTKQTKSGVEKSESQELTGSLNKRMLLPVGSTKNRKKKVLVNGKQVWRSMISGQVQDLSGQAISGKSSNANAEKGAQPKEE